MSEKKQAQSQNYKMAGVDIDEGNALIKDIAPFAAATKRAGVMGSLGGFGGLFDLKACGFNDPVLVAANDGVGTKLKIAIETGLHKTIGIDLVAMSVNDLIVQGAEPLFFLDYFACGKLERGVAKDVIEGISDGCKMAGCALLGGETAEMPGMYADGDYDLAGFCVGAVERDAMLPRTDIKTGDQIIGLSSSGIHSNGYSLVRHLIKQAGLNFHSPAPFSKGKTIGEAFLVPTKIYVAPLLKAFKEQLSIKALAHITGGGLPENLPRILPDDLSAHIDLQSFKAPSVFNWLQETGSIETAEMLRTFNCGIGMCIIAPKSDCGPLQTLFQKAGFDNQIIGEITPRTTDEPVTFDGSLQFA